MILLLASAPAALAVLSALIAALYRWQIAGGALLLAAYCATAITIDPAGFEFGGFHIFLEDLAAGLLVPAAALRLALHREAHRGWPVWLPFVAASIAAFVLGINLYGLKAAGVEFRPFFYLSAGILYWTSFPLDRAAFSRLAVLWTSAALVLVGLAWFRWAATALHLGIADQWALVGGGNRLRVLNASHTFFLAETLFILIFFRRHASRPAALTPLVLLLGATILLLQHRSVWIAAIAAGALLAWREGVFARFARGAALAAAAALFAYWLTPDRFSSSNEVAESLEASIEEPFSPERSTLLWRYGMWGEYLLEFAALSPARMLVGTGIGNPGLYQIGGTEVGHAAHNYFIYLLNRTGLCGLAALLMAYATILGRLRRPPPGWNYAGLFFCLGTSQLIYYVVYGPSYDQSLLIGAAIAAASHIGEVHAL